MTQSIEELNININVLKQKKENYKKQLVKINNDLVNLGLDDLDTYDNLKLLYNDNKEKYNVLNIYELLSYLLNINEEIGNFLTYNGFDDIDDVMDFVSKYKNHICINKPTKYLNHDELIENNYYSQLINSCYIINKQLKEKEISYNNLLKEVTYLRNLYLHDDGTRKINRLLDIKDVMVRPSKVSLNKAYYDRYFKILLNKKDEMQKNKSNKRFVLYRFRNIVNKVIYRNKKKIFNNKVNNAISNMKIYLANLLPPKVSLGEALYNKYKNERITNSINKLKFIKNKIIIINRIKKFLFNYKKQKRRSIPILEKNKKIINSIINANDRYVKSSLHDEIYKDNRNMIEKYSNYYEKYILENKKDEIKNIHEYYDKNYNRFLRILELFNYIKKDEEMFNSSYIFDYYKLSDVSKKDNNFKFFLPELKKSLGFSNSNNNRNNKPTLGSALYNYYNKYLEKDEDDDKSIDSYDEYDYFIKTCIFCDNANNIDETNGICSECTNNMNKTCSSDYEDF